MFNYEICTKTKVWFVKIIKFLIQAVILFGSKKITIYIADQYFELNKSNTEIVI